MILLIVSELDISPLPPSEYPESVIDSKAGRSKYYTINSGYLLSIIVVGEVLNAKSAKSIERKLGKSI